ncbi:hypothetical protein LTR15_011826 [Elasticomyces elasticus]|nr:hypothetical protein LTR15_011826 [Elasticomyces elasticus]
MRSNRTFQFISDPNHKENLSGRITAACVNCRRKKIKCGGGRECKACQEKGLVCKGPSFRERASNDDGVAVPTIVPDSDGASDTFSTCSMKEEDVTESQDAKYDTIQQLLSSMKPELGCERPGLNLKSLSHYVPTTSALSGAEDVGARSSRLIYPMPLRRPPHQGIAAALEHRLGDDESHSHRLPGHLIQEAEALEAKAGGMRQLASLRIRDDAMRVHREVQQHEEQRQQKAHVHSQSLQQPRSRPSNPNQAAFGVASPASMMSAGSGCWRSRYQFDASTIFRPDGVTLRTGLTSRGGEFGTWDHVNMQPSHSQSFGHQQQQHRLDFSTSPSYEMQQQQQAFSSSQHHSAVPTGNNRFRSKQGSCGSGSTASSSSTMGLHRMQAAFRTQLEAQWSGRDQGGGSFRAYHPPQ